MFKNSIIRKLRALISLLLILSWSAAFVAVSTPSVQFDPAQDADYTAVNAGFFSAKSDDPTKDSANWTVTYSRPDLDEVCDFYVDPTGKILSRTRRSTGGGQPTVPSDQSSNSDPLGAISGAMTGDVPGAGGLTGGELTAIAGAGGLALGALGALGTKALYNKLKSKPGGAQTPGKTTDAMTDTAAHNASAPTGTASGRENKTPAIPMPMSPLTGGVIHATAVDKMSSEPAEAPVASGPIEEQRVSMSAQAEQTPAAEGLPEGTASGGDEKDDKISPSKQIEEEVRENKDFEPDASFPAHDPVAAPSVEPAAAAHTAEDQSSEYDAEYAAALKASRESASAMTKHREMKPFVGEDPPEEPPEAHIPPPNEAPPIPEGLKNPVMSSTRVSTSGGAEQAGPVNPATASGLQVNPSVEVARPSTAPQGGSHGLQEPVADAEPASHASLQGSAGAAHVEQPVAIDGTASAHTTPVTTSPMEPVAPAAASPPEPPAVGTAAHRSTANPTPPTVKDEIEPSAEVPLLPHPHPSATQMGENSPAVTRTPEVEGPGERTLASAPKGVSSSVPSDMKAKELEDDSQAGNPASEPQASHNELSSSIHAPAFEGSQASIDMSQPELPRLLAHDQTGESGSPEEHLPDVALSHQEQNAFTRPAAGAFDQAAGTSQGAHENQVLAAHSPEPSQEAVLVQTPSVGPAAPEVADKPRRARSPVELPPAEDPEAPDKSSGVTLAPAHGSQEVASEPAATRTIEGQPLAARTSPIPHASLPAQSLSPAGIGEALEEEASAPTSPGTKKFVSSLAGEVKPLEGTGDTLDGPPTTLHPRLQANSTDSAHPETPQIGIRGNSEVFAREGAYEEKEPGEGELPAPASLAKVVPPVDSKAGPRSFTDVRQVVVAPADKPVGNDSELSAGEGVEKEKPAGDALNKVHQLSEVDPGGSRESLGVHDSQTPAPVLNTAATGGVIAPGSTRRPVGAPPELNLSDPQEPHAAPTNLPATGPSDQIPPASGRLRAPVEVENPEESEQAAQASLAHPGPLVDVPAQPPTGRRDANVRTIMVVPRGESSESPLGEPVEQQNSLSLNATERLSATSRPRSRPGVDPGVPLELDDEKAPELPKPTLMQPLAGAEVSPVRKILTDDLSSAETEVSGKGNLSGVGESSVTPSPVGPKRTKGNITKADMSEPVVEEPDAPKIEGTDKTGATKDQEGLDDQGTTAVRALPKALSARSAQVLSSAAPAELADEPTEAPVPSLSTARSKRVSVVGDRSEFGSAVSSGAGTLKGTKGVNAGQRLTRRSGGGKVSQFAPGAESSGGTSKSGGTVGVGGVGRPGQKWQPSQGSLPLIQSQAKQATTQVQEPSGVANSPALQGAGSTVAAQVASSRSPEPEKSEEDVKGFGEDDEGSPPLVPIQRNSTLQLKESTPENAQSEEGEEGEPEKDESMFAKAFKGPLATAQEDPQAHPADNSTKSEEPPSEGSPASAAHPTQIPAPEDQPSPRGTARRTTTVIREGSVEETNVSAENAGGEDLTGKPKRPAEGEGNSEHASPEVDPHAGPLIANRLSSFTVEVEPKESPAASPVGEEADVSTPSPLSRSLPQGPTARPPAAQDAKIEELPEEQETKASHSPLVMPGMKVSPVVPSLNLEGVNQAESEQTASGSTRSRQSGKGKGSGKSKGPGVATPTAKTPDSSTPVPVVPDKPTPEVPPIIPKPAPGGPKTLAAPLDLSALADAAKVPGGTSARPSTPSKGPLKPSAPAAALSPRQEQQKRESEAFSTLQQQVRASAPDSALKQKLGWIDIAGQGEESQKQALVKKMLQTAHGTQGITDPVALDAIHKFQLAHGPTHAAAAEITAARIAVEKAKVPSSPRQSSTSPRPLSRSGTPRA